MSWYLSKQSRPKSTVGRYHSGMLRRSLTALWAGLLMAAIAVYPAGVAQASPSGDDGTGQCSFILTQPKVVQVSGLTLVSATLRPGPCTMHASPNSSVVCLSVAGGGMQGECASKNGPDPAEVRYPYQPGSTYVLRAQGCASTFVPPYTLCQDFGPSQTTL
jgi:disulfide bond formation protein DsbB